MHKNANSPFLPLLTEWYSVWLWVWIWRVCTSVTEPHGARCRSSAPPNSCMCKEMKVGKVKIHWSYEMQEMIYEQN